MSEFPADLLELQLAVLRAEAVYVAAIGRLYGHPVLVRAREDGRVEAVTARLRDVARAA